MAGSACGHGDKFAPPLALLVALSVLLLPSAWHTGHYQLGLPAAAQALSLGAGVAALSTQRAAGAAWHQFGSAGSTGMPQHQALPTVGLSGGKATAGGTEGRGVDSPQPPSPTHPGLRSECSGSAAYGARRGRCPGNMSPCRDSLPVTGPQTHHPHHRCCCSSCHCSSCHCCTGPRRWRSQSGPC